MDAAKAALKMLRKNCTDEQVDSEIEALRHSHSTEKKGPWSAVFDKSNRKRTMIAVVAMFGQQITGQAFSSQYSVIFYQSQGFGDRSFLFNILSNVTGLVCIFLAWYFVDNMGRRKLLMIGGSGMAIFLLIVGSVGTIPEPTEAQKEVLVRAWSSKRHPCGRFVLRQLRSHPSSSLPARTVCPGHPCKHPPAIK